MRSIAVASGKGGVGKTSCAVNLAAGFASLRKLRTLIVDLDHGAHATKWLLGGRQELGIADSMLLGDLTHVTGVPGRENLAIAPASPALQTIEASLANTFGRETILREIVKAKRRLVDVVIYDCPPGVGFLTQSAVFAADTVIVPVLPGFMGIDGLTDMRKLVDEIRRRGRARVDIAGAVMFAVDDRTAMAEGTRQSVRNLGMTALFDSEIRISTASTALPSAQALVFDGDDPRGAEDYRALLKETEARLDGR